MWIAEGKTIAQPDRVIRGLHFRCAGGIVGDASQTTWIVCETSQTPKQLWATPHTRMGKRGLHESNAGGEIGGMSDEWVRVKGGSE